MVKFSVFNRSLLHCSCGQTVMPFRSKPQAYLSYITEDAWVIGSALWSRCILFDAQETSAIWSRFLSLLSREDSVIKMQACWTLYPYNCGNIWLWIDVLSGTEFTPSPVYLAVKLSKSWTQRYKRNDNFWRSSHVLFSFHFWLFSFLTTRRIIGINISLLKALSEI